MIDIRLYEDDDSIRMMIDIRLHKDDDDCIRMMIDDIVNVDDR
jgi:hypothetical protein